ncbi:hypothetical protein D8I35_02225 [Corticibacter populi]|uniref:Uncharacterized protein n=1 Tax=Corticibacter populi TaxID=1550736 RepID=A0A3M6QYJ5_9BURK|nr:hypothetical protein [Corticibacter populi]RMX07963.1 hypothetical protein D8I35_02225 [Corticibacter populi]
MTQARTHRIAILAPSAPTLLDAVPKTDLGHALEKKVTPPYRPVLRKTPASDLALEQDDLASHPADVAAFITHARHAIERRCVSAY